MSRSDSPYACGFCDPERPRPDCAICNGTGYDTAVNDVPVCPHCGKEQSTDDLDENTTSECSDCGKQFDIEIGYDVYYTTRRHPEQAK